MRLLYGIAGLLTGIGAEASETAKISVFVEPIGLYSALANVTMYDLFQKTRINNVDFYNGTYHFNYPVGRNLSLLFQHEAYQTTQIGTFKVDASGFVGKYNQLSWQAVPTILWDVFKYIVEIEDHLTMKPGFCQVGATITAYHKTLDDDPQGEPGAVADLISPDAPAGMKLYDKVYYTGIHDKKTFPVPGLKKTTKDGGAFFINVLPGYHYQMVATKPGVEFSVPQFICAPELWPQVDETILINLSPPQGPTVLDP